jgi:hypothetical protein
MNTSTTTQLLLTLSAIIGIHCTAHAQANDAKVQPSTQWYQVELIIFANNNLADANKEIWSKELGLKYPQRMVKLKTAVEMEALILANKPLNSADEPSQLTINDSTLNDSILNNSSENAISANPVQIGGTETGSTLEQNSPPPSSPSTLTTPNDLSEQPFILLDDSQLDLKQVARRIFSNADFRALYHAKWHQPINDASNSENILIQGGNQFDNHFELEGSINLSVQRYLHLNTNLWLSSFISNVGQQTNPWPMLPKLPFSANSSSLSDIQSPQNNLFSNSMSSTPNLDWEYDDAFIDLTAKQYSVEQTYALRQHRRMRSNELHYIDHPLMGLLIKITPYELELAD